MNTIPPNICGQLINASDGSRCANPKPCKWHDFAFCVGSECDGVLEVIAGGHLHPLVDCPNRGLKLCKMIWCRTHSWNRPPSSGVEQNNPSPFRVTCTSLDCPERKGGVCKHDPRGKTREWDSSEGKTHYVGDGCIPAHIIDTSTIQDEFGKVYDDCICHQPWNDKAVHSPEKCTLKAYLDKQIEEVLGDDHPLGAQEMVGDHAALVKKFQAYMNSGKFMTDSAQAEIDTFASIAIDHFAGKEKCIGCEPVSVKWGCPVHSKPTSSDAPKPCTVWGIHSHNNCNGSHDIPPKNIKRILLPSPQSTKHRPLYEKVNELIKAFNNHLNNHD